MRKPLILVILILSFGISLSAPPLGAQSRAKAQALKDLEPKYRQWLEEEVVYIITQKEREVFLQLQTNRERDIFIEAFWKQRDPTPNTPDNEFKTEHYRRIKYANQYFGKDSPQPGWKTDMGRIYIMLGEPKQIERYENQSDIYPLQVWFYDGMADLGLPNAFYVMFFKKYSAGEYILYSPIRDGPQQLMVHYSGDMTSYTDAYSALYERYPTLAPISISLIPGEVTTGITPTMSSDILIANKIPRAPTYKVKDSYAEKLLAYKDIVEVDYTANYIESDALVGVFQDTNGVAYIHYLVEPSRLSFEQYGDRFLSNLEVDGNITDGQGRFVYQFDRRVPIEMNSRQLAAIRDKLFSFQDIFPVVPGNYRLSVILKNTVSKEFTTFERTLIVPGPGEAWISPLVLSYRTERDSKYAGQVKPFLLRGVQLRPSPRNEFLQSDTLGVFFQLHGLKEDLRRAGSLELAFFREGEKVHSLSRRLSEIPDLGGILEEFSLAAFPPAYYTVEAIVTDGAGKTVISEKAQFMVTPAAGLSRPWVLSMPFPSPDSPEILYIMGKQRLNRKETAEAVRLLAAAAGRVPEEPRYALDLARAYFEAGDLKQARETARPFMDDQKESGFLLLMGQSSQKLGELGDAVSFYRTYLQRFGTNISVLNALGECYMTLGEREEALTAFERSLQIEPNQEKVKALVRTLKEKK